MKLLRDIILEAEQNKTAIGHFNVSDIAGLNAIFQSARALSLPVIVGASESEREFIGAKLIAYAVRDLRESYNYPIFLNADHTHSFEKAKEAVEAGFDAVLFDGGAKLKLEENIKETKRVVEFVKSARPEVLVEGELGYIGGSSSIHNNAQTITAISRENLALAGEAKRLVEETGIDLLAPAVGNIHGMLKHSKNPALDIARIKEIRETCGVPLVLHGGSGISDEDFLRAIDAGISIIHINTEIRLAWRKGIERALAANQDEVTPYKLLPYASEEMKKIIEARLKLFSRRRS